MKGSFRLFTTGAFVIRLFGILPLAITAWSQFPSDNLVLNPGFERAFRKGEWEYLNGNSDTGYPVRTRDWAQDGNYSIKLVPNSKNEETWLPFEFALTQSLSPTKFNGKPLYFSASMRAEGGATAVMRIFAALKNGQFVFRELRESGSTAVRWEDIYDVPAAEIVSMQVMISVKGKSGAAYFDDVIVSESMTSKIVKKGQYDPGLPLWATIAVSAGTVVRNIPRDVYGMNVEWAFNGHTLWDQYNQRLNDRITGIASDAGITLWRYPGGVFANHYHWKNGIGPQNTRPVVAVEPGASLSENGFGTDEVFDFAARTGASGLIMTVNANTGTPQEAAEWVKYSNNGSRRARYWEIGNELYLRVVDADNNLHVWTPEEYSQTFMDFAKAMRESDPDIKLGADIEFHYPFDGCSQIGETGCWTDVILKQTASQLDFVSVHNGFAPLGLAPLGGPDAGWDVRTVYSSLMSFPILYKRLMDGLSDRIDALAGENAPRIKIAATEWGPLYTIGDFSRLVDHVKTLGSGLMVSGVMNVLVSHPRIEVATAFKLIDEVVYGWLGPRQGLYVVRAPYLAFQLWSRNFLPVLVRTDLWSPTYDSRSVLGMPAIQGVPYLEAATSVNEDRTELVMIVTNRHFDRPIRTSIQLADFYSQPDALALTLNGTGIDANTGTDLPPGWAAQAVAVPDGRFEKGGPGEVSVESTQFKAGGSCLVYEFPAHSVTVLKFKANAQPVAPDPCLQPAPEPTSPSFPE